MDILGTLYAFRPSESLEWNIDQALRHYQDVNEIKPYMVIANQKDLEDCVPPGKTDLIIWFVTRGTEYKMRVVEFSGMPRGMFAIVDQQQYATINNWKYIWKFSYETPFANRLRKMIDEDNN